MWTKLSFKERIEIHQPTFLIKLISSLESGDKILNAKTLSRHETQNKILAYLD